MHDFRPRLEALNSGGLAHHVVLASHLDASLVTTDVRLANAPNLGVPTITAAEPDRDARRARTA